MQASWLRPTMAIMGGCTPAGFLTLIAILSDGHINLDKFVWALLAGGGAALGFCFGNLATRGRFGFR